MSTKYDFAFGEKRSDSTANAHSTLKNLSPYNAIVYVSVVILIAVTAFLVGVMFERQSNAASSAEMATFWQAWDILDDNFYGEKPEVEQLRYGAIDGLVTAYEDPYTSYSPPEIAQVRRQEIDGHFGGVGVSIRQNESMQVVAVMVFPGGPADKAGILPDDIFMEVDGQSVVGWDTARLAEIVRGEIGTQVELTMYRPSEDETYEVSVTRAIIETPTVFSEILDNNVGYINLTSFSGVATTQMQDHLQDLIENDGATSLILDLRDNRGGLLQQAVSIADLFLDDGTVLIQRSSDGSEDVFRSEDGDFAESIPMVILVNNNTASAAEVVAGALQDRDRAELIGNDTFGKGVVQLVYNLTDGSQLRVTSSAWYTPEDRAINENGLSPNLLIDQPFDMEGNDLALRAGLEYLAPSETDNTASDE